MHVQLKICGVTRASDLDACAELDVDAVGINLWAGSRRGLTLDDASVMLGSASEAARALTKVGVFVDATPQEVREAVARLRLDAIQMHDDQPLAPFAALGVPWIWVIRGTPDLRDLAMPQPRPTWILLDAAVPGYGGQGHRTDWVWAAQAVTWFAPCPVWLAGGITPENVAQALRAVEPAGIDVASGAEMAAPTWPGAKDVQRIRELRAACRGFRVGL